MVDSMDAIDGFWRVCAECSEWLMGNDAVSADVYCRKCKGRQPTFDEWADGVKPGDAVYLQPYCAIDGLSRSPHIVIARHGRMLTVQRLGYTKRQIEVSVNNCGPRDMTPNPRYAMY